MFAGFVYGTLIVYEAQRSEARADRFLSEHRVGGGSKVIAEKQLLIHGFNAKFTGPSRFKMPGLGIAEPDAALIGLVNSAENFHQCALAGTVVSNQSYDLPRHQVQ